MIDYLYSTIIISFIILIMGIGISLAVNQFFLKNASSFGKNKGAGNQIRWATAAKPPVGGMSFYAVFIFLIVVIGIFSLIGFVEWSASYMLIGLFVPMTIGFFVGLADDSYNTSPLIKFIGQFLCAIFFIISGNYVHVTGSEWFNYWFTIVWVVGMMNSINMLDNMDGVVSSVSIVSLGIALMIVTITGNINVTDVVLIVGIMGSLIGFLFFNWNPAKIYMGDTGSQFLGAFLAWISIEYFWIFRDNVEGGFQARQFLVPALAFIVPLMDTTTVTFRRLARKVSPFVGGRDHTTHHLAFLGISDKNVVRIMIGISVLSAFVVYQIIHDLQVASWSFYKTIAIVTYYLTIFGGLQYFYELAKKKINADLDDNNILKIEKLDEILN